MGKLIITVDLEEWFQVENLRAWFPPKSWESQKLKCERNVYKLLYLFDKNGIRATFFTLAWIAKQKPELVREIKKMGHEIASHGCYHTSLTRLTSYEVKKDLIESKNILEDIIGDKIAGYRAPNFSINDELLYNIYKSGYIYDSSYNSFSLNKRYGKPTVLMNKKNAISKLFDHFYELPVSNLYIKGLALPWAGGAYFRLIPLPLFALGVRYILRKEGRYLFYMHPWEIDPHQYIPRGISLQYKIRHYSNLKNTFDKLSKFLEILSRRHKFITCIEYLKDHEAIYSKGTI